MSDSTANNTERGGSPIPQPLIDLLVSDVLSKHNVSEPPNLSDEQRKQLKALVQDMQKQVDEFLNKQKEK
ncbi:hypothetical protein [Aneurinibacillus tyrosinisolvens]|uniref:hypothetical protein n=1 Tax=Aneurinibacillus tyrosinisolvens TaxID=1443435 RepID=UPI00063FD1E0|nr:hypothetical protein [Aneurinibacillus tyrosinisolvens]